MNVQRVFVLVTWASAMVSAFGAVTMTAGTAASRTPYPRSLSGITYAGGNTYYAVADDNGPEGGLYKYTVSVSADGKSVTSQSISTNNVIKLPNTYDLEGVAFDPASGNVWAADETRETIKEYDPTTGAVVSEIPVPAVIKNYNVGNYGMESLTISGDGLTMWTSNEEALTCDGARSSPTNGTTVRLVKYVRETVCDTFRLAAMYPYTTDKLLHETCSSCRHGVADMVALPDDSLLIVERDYSKWGTLPDDFAYSIYRVTDSDLAAATDVKDVSSLKSAAWTAVKKTKVVEDINLKFVNYEGLCLGPRLENGNISLLLVSDAGDGSTNSKILPFVLSGLDIRTLNFPAPASGDAPSLVGSNYRFLNGTTVSVSLAGEGLAPVAYTNDGARVATASWTLTASRRSGTGTTASFAVSGDDTLEWTVSDSSARSPIVAHDTFEEPAAGTSSDNLPGWGDSGTVVAATYSAPSVGTPMQRANHTQVLAVDTQLSRDYAAKSATRQQLDMMVKVLRPAEDEEASWGAGCQAGIHVRSDGRIMAVHADGAGGMTTTLAAETVFAEGEWVRVTMALDYTLAQPVFVLRLNGAYCGTYPCAGGKRSIAGFDLVGDTAVDDVIFTDGDPDFEIAEEAMVSSGKPKDLKVASAWFDRYGLDWQALGADADGDGLKAWEEYLAGSSPTDNTSVFKIIGFAAEGETVEVAFSGELPRPDFLVVRGCAELGGVETTLDGAVTTREDSVSVWRAKVPSNFRFFRACIQEKGMMR